MSEVTPPSCVLMDPTNDVTIMEQVSPELYKVCPASSELGAPAQKDIPCPVIGCPKICCQASALRFHMEKTHKIFKEKYPWEVTSTQVKPTVHWHCPDAECMYNITQTRYFNSRTLLRQHFGKMHLAKTLPCSECGRLFGLAKDRRRHMVGCGNLVYTCSCGKMYAQRASYLMHCARQQHDILDHYKLEKPSAKLKKETEADVHTPRPPLLGKSSKNKPEAEPGGPRKMEPEAPGRRKLQPILPNPNLVVLVMTENGSENANTNIVPSHLIYVADARSSSAKDFMVGKKSAKSVGATQPSQMKSSISSTNGDTQTDRTLSAESLQSGLVKPGAVEEAESPSSLDVAVDSSQKDASRPVKHKRRVPRLTAATQTLTMKHKRAAAQTQTTGDFILRHAMQTAELPVQRESRGSQVSPRAKVKRSRSHVVQSIETQTSGSPRSVQKRRRKRQTSDCGMNTSATPELAVSDHNLQGGVLSMPNSWPSQSQTPNSWSASTETQTMALLDELEATLGSGESISLGGESISTQTLESFTTFGAGDMHQFPTIGQTGLTETMDQAVLCDLGLNYDLDRLPDMMNAATSPRTRSRSTVMTVDCGTDAICVGNIADEGETFMIPMLTDQTVLHDQTISCDPCDGLLSVDGSHRDHHDVLQPPGSTGQSDHMVSTPVRVTEPTEGQQSNRRHGNVLHSQPQMSSASCPVLSATQKTELPGPRICEEYSPSAISVFTSSTVTSSSSMISTASEPFYDHSTFLDPPTVPASISSDFSADINTGTQTLVTHLDFPELLTSGVQTSDYDTSYMNIETQTTDGNIIDLLLSNMQTQTTEDFLADLSFSDIETQTHFSIGANQGSSGMNHGMTQTVISSTNQEPAPSIGIQTQDIVNTGHQVTALSIGIQTIHDATPGSIPSADTQTQTVPSTTEFYPDLSDSYMQTGFDDLESFVDTLSNI